MSGNRIRPIEDEVDATTITAAEYERIALADPSRKLELVRGRLREKPMMTAEHNQLPRELLLQLVDQIDRERYIVDSGTTKLRISTGTFYIPDLCVIPREYHARLRERVGTFEVYEDPLPLVVEVWSPSTGGYDVDTKLAEYQWRGDLEIWRIHPYQRTLTAWLRRPDGSYGEVTHRGGVVHPAALPGVAIDFDLLFK